MTSPAAMSRRVTTGGAPKRRRRQPEGEGVMTPDEVRACILRHVEKYGSHDATALAADHATDGAVESPRAGTCRGRPAIEQVYRSWFSAFPDLKLTVETLLVENDRAAVFCRVAATHHGRFLGVQGTGKAVEFPMVYLQTWKDNQIIHERRIYDFSGVLVRLGVLKVKPG